MSAAGTWRPAPADAGGGPGTYATTLAFLIARRVGAGAGTGTATGTGGSGSGSAREVAETLAGRLRGAAGIGAVSVTGDGYLTITVTDAALTSLAARVVAAGPDCAASDALRGTALPAPCLPDLAAADGWEQAWRWSVQEITSRLAARAGAKITVNNAAKRAPVPHPGPPASTPVAAASTPVVAVASTPVAAAGSPVALAGLPVAAAIAFAGADAVRYALARTAAGRAGEAGGRIPVSRGLDNRFSAVLFAHADAASTLRWAADLGQRRAGIDWAAPGLLAHPPERELLTAISWLPERVAGAAHRRQPHELAAFVEYLAGAWLDCRESCPALPFGGRAALVDAAGASARLWLADAARTALAAGLQLLGVAAPQRV